MTKWEHKATRSHLPQVEQVVNANDGAVGGGGASKKV